MIRVRPPLPSLRMALLILEARPIFEAPRRRANLEALRRWEALLTLEALCRLEPPRIFEAPRGRANLEALRGREALLTLEAL